ncbi:aspartate kinase [Nonlabens spongiae]|uniref:Aspartokinase n=1 Tax=Nonlabens spongiae TaxID=331648 RepID=A0A1W6MJW4_9FLAO|nr:aspartate kinase [Nonlabens spongiae]ARN77904.1 aspartate kinase [Nonlabens spongiae]
MNIYKFGGASVKDAVSVANVCRIIKAQETTDLGIVVSAMGKTTNALEEVIALYRNDDSRYLNKIDDLLDYHLNVVRGLQEFANDQGDECGLRFRESGIINTIKGLLESLKGTLLRNQSKNYSFVYDQTVCYGELLSTKIVAAYLNACGLDVEWMDARGLIRTDHKYRDAGVDWKKSEKAITENCTGKFFLTQGFIGSDENGLTTTLGREGSDYTAGILAYCLDAEAVTIWKDVPGVLNADPREFEDTTLIESMPYSEAIELAFYGASVIHPKTLQPLQGKKIALKVRSFVNHEAQGTVIQNQDGLVPHMPCFIVRKNMIFLRIAARDFSFIGERNISDIFDELNTYKVQVGLLQNSAISFSLCLEDKYEKIDELVKALAARYQVSKIPNVSLYTVRHYNDESVQKLASPNEVILKQFTQETLQLIVKNDTA